MIPCPLVRKIKTSEEYNQDTAERSLESSYTIHDRDNYYDPKNEVDQKGEEAQRSRLREVVHKIRGH